MINCVASSECPPSSKKLSVTPTCSTLSTSANSFTSSASVCVRGRTSAPFVSGRELSATGGARWLTCPLGAHGGIGLGPLLALLFQQREQHGLGAGAAAACQRL